MCHSPRCKRRSAHTVYCDTHEPVLLHMRYHMQTQRKSPSGESAASRPEHGLPAACGSVRFDAHLFGGTPTNMAPPLPRSITDRGPPVWVTPYRERAMQRRPSDRSHRSQIGYISRTSRTDQSDRSMRSHVRQRHRRCSGGTPQSRPSCSLPPGMASSRSLVYCCCGWSNTSSVVACSTSLPCCITTTSSAI